jgi:hypothetical protein
VLPPEPDEPFRLARAEALEPELLRHGSVVVAVPHPQRPRLVLVEPLRAVLPDRLEHAVPGCGVLSRLVTDDDRLVDEARHQVQHVIARDAVALADLLGGIEVEAAGEDGEPRPHGLLGGRAEVVAPADRRVQRLLPGRHRGLATGEQAEPVLEALQDLFRREDAQPHRRELDRQRDPVEPTTQIEHRGPVALHDREVRRHGRGPVEEERHGVVVGGVACPDLLVGVRDGQWRHQEDLLALDPEHVPAGGEDAQPGGRGQQLADQHRTGIGEVFAVVEDDQKSLLLQIGRQVGRGVVRDHAQLERVGDGVRQQERVVECSQLDEPHAVGKRTPDLGRHPQRQPRLADASGARQGEHAAAGKELPGLGQLASTAHEAGQLGGQSAPT